MERTVTRVRKGLRCALVPLIILGIVVGVNILGALGIIPTANQLALVLEEWFRAKGMVAVGGCAFVENLVGVNAYFPGSVVILIGMGATNGDPPRAAVTFVIIVCCSLLGQLASYVLGRLLHSSPQVVEARILPIWTFASTFWHPHFAAATSVTAGAGGMRLRAYLSRMVPVACLWYAFWGTLMYWMGGVGEAGNWLSLVFIVYLMAWISITFAKGWTGAVPRRRTASAPPRNRPDPGMKSPPGPLK